MALEYRLEAECNDTEARLGRVQTFHGEFETPIFMPVGTQAVVKALTASEVEAVGAQIILGNTYHPLRDRVSRLCARSAACTRCIIGLVRS